MRLKYYLRGIGIGVIVATLIMMISSAINDNHLSEETIIKEASKLGMIMPENTEEKDSLWVQSTETESQTEDDDMHSSTPEEEDFDTQITDTENLEHTESAEALDNAEPEVIQITIEPANSATLVAQKLYDAGVIDSAEAFREYLQEMNYTHSIRTGVFSIPKGSSYEEICHIIMRR